MGSDGQIIDLHVFKTGFQSTLPGWGATDASKFGWISDQFQSTLPGWGATRGQPHVVIVAPISIHAPRMGSDSTATWSAHPDTYFNPRSPDGERPVTFLQCLHQYIISIHAPRMGSDVETATSTSTSIFQSTLPGWGATASSASVPLNNSISIHAPRMGSDCPAFVIMRRTLIFQSTLPGWGATQLQRGQSVPIRISIHAPRMGSDCRRRAEYRRAHDFNPRSPDGERPSES